VLFEALKAQQATDPDSIFGARQTTCDLGDMFAGVQLTWTPTCWLLMARAEYVCVRHVSCLHFVLWTINVKAPVPSVVHKTKRREQDDNNVKC
jgi:hypothetical protein